METAIELDEFLRQHGHRVTGPRRLVWSVLTEADSHLTAEQIAGLVEKQDPTVNLSSIYRSLALFAELSIARESSLDVDGPAQWELAHPDDHFHLRCRKCGRVEHHIGDQVDQIRTHLRTGHQFFAEQVELVVSGLCADCFGVAETAAEA